MFLHVESLAVFKVVFKQWSSMAQIWVNVKAVLSGRLLSHRNCLWMVSIASVVGIHIKKCHCRTTWSPLVVV